MAQILNGEIAVGIVYDFLHNRLYYASKGNGAYLNGRRIQVKKRPFNQSLVTYAPLVDVRRLPDGAPAKGKYEDELVYALREGENKITIDSRRFERQYQSGGLELSWVATGQLDGYASSWTNPWDLSAEELGL
jgi:myo-inositol-1(or 4)-monophosphatase